jgi:hypothetical protein
MLLLKGQNLKSVLLSLVFSSSKCKGLIYNGNSHQHYIQGHNLGSTTEHQIEMKRIIDSVKEKVLEKYGRMSQNNHLCPETHE